MAESDADSDLTDENNIGDNNRLPQPLMNLKCHISGGDHQIWKLLSDVRRNVGEIIDSDEESDNDVSPVKK